jgi:hypothetical protein
MAITSPTGYYSYVYNDRGARISGQVQDDGSVLMSLSNDTLDAAWENPQTLAALKPSGTPPPEIPTPPASCPPCPVCAPAPEAPDLDVASTERVKEATREMATAMSAGMGAGLGAAMAAAANPPMQQMRAVMNPLGYQTMRAVMGGGRVPGVTRSQRRAIRRAVTSW